MNIHPYPQKLATLGIFEEHLREEALRLIAASSRLMLHVKVVECAMDVGEVLRRLPTEDEDLKVAQLLGMRTFNAFGSSLRLALSGYFQISALVMRDILETVFLLDLFRGDRAAIKQWRFADKRERLKKFARQSARSA